MDIVVWLRSLGLGKYEAAFRENDIDETIDSSSSMPLPLCVTTRALRRFSNRSPRL